jgi:hypothetical protein
MNVLLSVWLAQVDALVQSYKDELPQHMRYKQIKAAVEQYSVDVPCYVTDDISGDGGRYYALDGLSNWVKKHSSIRSVQYPAPSVASDELPIYLTSDQYDSDYWDGDEQYILFTSVAPASTEAVRITYSVPYAWEQSTTSESVTQNGHGFSVNNYVHYDDVESTWVLDPVSLNATHVVTAVADTNNFTATMLHVDIPQSDFFGVTYLAASIVCEAISAKYSRTTDNSIVADSVNHYTRGQEFSRRAKEFYDMYRRAFQLGSSGSGGSGSSGSSVGGEFVKWPSIPVTKKRPFLYH